MRGRLYVFTLCVMTIFPCFQSSCNKNEKTSTQEKQIITVDNEGEITTFDRIKTPNSSLNSSFNYYIPYNTTESYIGGSALPLRVQIVTGQDISELYKIHNFTSINIINACIIDKPYFFLVLKKQHGLKSLTLHAFNLSHYDLESISSLSEIEYLDLSLNTIDDFPLHYLGQLSNLKELKLRNTLITPNRIEYISEYCKKYNVVFSY